MPIRNSLAPIKYLFANRTFDGIETSVCEAGEMSPGVPRSNGSLWKEPHGAMNPLDEEFSREMGALVELFLGHLPALLLDRAVECLEQLDHDIVEPIFGRVRLHVIQVRLLDEARGSPQQITRNHGVHTVDGKLQ